MCEEARCQGLLEVGDTAEGRCVWEVEVGESHFEVWRRVIVDGDFWDALL